MTDFAPSEEHTLICDVPNCQAALSMVSGVPRSEHGWGRISLYGGTAAADYVVTEVRDYDLCAGHYKAVMAVLR
jgi:hypothetical protein